VGALARVDGKILSLSGAIASTKGQQVLRDQQRGQVENPAELGVKLAEVLLSRGAGEILKHYGRY
jgi:hydroxymethylbilane synthase